MTEWAMEYWYLLVAALLIGAAVAAWIWLRRDPEAGQPVREIDERPSGPLEPVRPVIEVAERVDFAAMPRTPAPTPVAATGDRPAIAPANGDPDDLSRIKGVGPKLVALLASLGITRFDQIAAWTADDIAEVDRFLGAFQGRITRDAWVEQAGYLARGDIGAFTARFGALGEDKAG